MSYTLVKLYLEKLLWIVMTEKAIKGNAKKKRWYATKENGGREKKTIL